MKLRLKNEEFNGRTRLKVAAFFDRGTLSTKDLDVIKSAEADFETEGRFDLKKEEAPQGAEFEL